MQKRSALWSLPLLALCASVLLACGGDDSDDEATTPITSTGAGSTASTGSEPTGAATSQADATTTIPSTGTTGATESTAGDATGPTDADAALDDAVAAYASETFSATYSIDYSSPDVDFEVGELTIAVDADGGRSALIFSGEASGQSLDIALIETPDAVYRCFHDPGGAPQCLRADPGTAGGLTFRTVIDAISVENLSANLASAAESVDSSEGTVAGRDATCFEITGPEASGTVCIDRATRAVLRIEGEDADGSFQLEATEFSESVSDSDFEPPFELIGP